MDGSSGREQQASQEARRGAVREKLAALEAAGELAYDRLHFHLPEPEPAAALSETDPLPHTPESDDPALDL